MNKKHVVKHDNFKPKIICDYLTRFFVGVGSRLYIFSEKCSYHSRYREQKIKLDKEYKEREEVAKMVLDNKELKEKTLRTEGFSVPAEDVVKALGEHHIGTKKQLEDCHLVIWSLWEAYRDQEYEKMEDIFADLGLLNKETKGEY